MRVGVGVQRKERWGQSHFVRGTENYFIKTEVTIKIEEGKDEINTSNEIKVKYQK